MDGTPPDVGSLPGGGQAVGFLLSQLGLVVSRQFHDVIGIAGLAPREFALLRAIAEADGASQTAVSERLGIPASTLVTIVDRLEADALLERRTHPFDRRSRTLHVTAAGQKVLKEAVELAVAYERNLCADLTGDERGTLLDLLDRVAVRLEIRRGVHPGLVTGDGQQCGGGG